ncbi:MAG: HAMP domain-containing sensor histidine kinase [Deltaproteobacteria bacterium]|nr:HAMP domain-containing sensor histidine kinase [Deltaproteobacteria bacterium]
MQNTLQALASLDAFLDAEAVRVALRDLWPPDACALTVVREDGSTWIGLDEPIGPYALCQLVDGYESTRSACESLVQLTLRGAIAQRNVVTEQCFTGALYVRAAIRVAETEFGRVIAGPFRAPNAVQLDASLTALEPAIEDAQATREFALLPSLDATVARERVHVIRVLLETLCLQRFRELGREDRAHAVSALAEELARKNEALLSANEHLRELDRIKGNFLATISHELKTPLTSIMGYAEMLGENIGGDLSTEQRNFVRVIFDRAQQLHGMITSLIELARMDHTRSSHHFASVDIVALVREASATFAPIARKRNMELSVELEPDLPSVWGDQGYLRQVLQNLVDNALKFTPDGGRIVISLRSVEAPLPSRRVEESDDENIGSSVLNMPVPAIELSVRDSGVGIPVSERPRVFDAFYQVDAGVTRQFGGAGLGLAIVRRVVLAHRGLLEIGDPENGIGAVITITLHTMQTS